MNIMIFDDILLNTLNNDENAETVPVGQVLHYRACIASGPISGPIPLVKAIGLGLLSAEICRVSQGSIQGRGISGILMQSAGKCWVLSTCRRPAKIQGHPLSRLSCWLLQRV